MPILTVHRARLLEGLVKLVDKQRCHFQKRLLDIKQGTHGSNQCMLHFHDGSTVEADTVLGCDGVHSTVRKHILGEDHPALYPQYTGAVAYRGIIPMERVVARLGEEVALNTFGHFGPGALTLSYPIERGTLANIVLIDVGHGGEVGEQWNWPAKIDEVREKVKGFSDPVQGITEVGGNCEGC